jgi:hypothetical protein
MFHIQEGEVPTEPKRASARRPPEASGGHRPCGRSGSAGASPSQMLIRPKVLRRNVYYFNASILTAYSPELSASSFQASFARR